MRNQKMWVYPTVVGVLGCFVFFLIRYGQGLERNLDTVKKVKGEANTDLLQPFLEHLHHPLAVLLLQIVTIIFVARLLGRLAVYIGQPTVIGEILAGILLGPSLLGKWFPAFSAFLFPKTSLPNLQFLSQIGLIFFMFIIGMELDFQFIKRRARDAIIISHTGISLLYFLGVGLALFLYEDFAPKGISFLPFALFMGIAMSITAFPVLARIVQERGMTKQAIGSLVIACAASDDITAWCILAVVIAIVNAGSVSSALLSVLFTAAFVLFMLYVVKPVLERVAERNSALETVSKPILALFFMVILAAAYATEVIGIHALFGAFMAGIAIPVNPEFRRVLANKVEDFSLVLLLPLFFVTTGLRTEIGLLNEPRLWAICGFIIFIAAFGKIVGSTLAARLVGQNWKNALTIGALMNTRGLMELVVLNIGYDLGILTPQVFAMMVLMAITTTFMTGPLLNLIEYVHNRYKKTSKQVSEGFKVLISFGQPKAGRRLLEMADQLGLTQIKDSEITALHLTPSADISIQNARHFEREGFAPILEKANELSIRIQKNYKATNNLNNEIITFANEGDFDLMLVGSAQPIFSNDAVGGKVRNFLDDAEPRVGVLIDRNFVKLTNILFLMQTTDDLSLLQYAPNTALNRSVFVLQSDASDFIKSQLNLQKIQILETTKTTDVIGKSALKSNDLLVVSRSFWDSIKPDRHKWLEHSPSILIIR
jgi:Kef-type K+ transport system membrane component KefB